MQSCYYIAGPEVRLKLMEWEREQGKSTRAGRKLAKSVGALHAYWDSNSIVGFQFPEPPDSKLWCKLKGTGDGYKPRATTAAGKQLLAKMATLTRADAQDVADIVGIPASKRFHFDSEIGSFVMTGAGCEPVKGPNGAMEYIITVRKGIKVQGCRRISDLDYEKIIANQKRKAKK